MENNLIKSVHSFSSFKKTLAIYNSFSILPWMILPILNTFVDSIGGRNCFIVAFIFLVQKTNKKKKPNRFIYFL